MKQVREELMEKFIENFGFFSNFERNFYTLRKIREIQKTLNKICTN